MTNRFYSSVAQPTTLSAACTEVAGTIQVSATTGFPAAPFILAVDYGANQQELVLVTGVAGTTLTVTRGYDNTSAAPHSVGAAVRHVHSAIDFRDSRSHENASAGVHGVIGSVVGTTDAQALTNKDLTSGTNTFPATLATTGGAQTLANKTIALGSNTVSGTKAQFDAAVTDADLASLAGTETLTNKTLTSPTITSPTITGVGAVSTVVKAADESVASMTTLQDDNELTLSVPAAGGYLFDLCALVTGPTAADINIAFSFPTGTCTWAPVGLLDQTAVGATSGVTQQTLQTSLGVTAYHVRGYLNATASGTLLLKWTQAASNASNTTVKAGSHLTLTRIA
jgi:hypothetical protein